MHKDLIVPERSAAHGVVIWRTSCDITCAKNEFAPMTSSCTVAIAAASSSFAHEDGKPQRRMQCQQA